jgi:hypothetical protein
MRSRVLWQKLAIISEEFTVSVIRGEELSQTNKRQAEYAAGTNGG